MERIILNIKDNSKLPFLMQLISHFDFVEMEKDKKLRKAEAKKHSGDYNFFNSAGLWAGRDVNAKEIRKQAWNRTKHYFGIRTLTNLIMKNTKDKLSNVY